MSDTPDILKKILATKIKEISRRKLCLSINNLQKHATTVEGARGFADALQAKALKQQPAIIAEIKKASPSKGVIREDFQPLDIALDYAKNGATCLSVLTDHDYFQGAEVYLQIVREKCSLPVLRKDFIIDPYQVYESRALGADCILLIVAALADKQMLELATLSQDLGMDVLIEAHNYAELQRGLKVDTPLIGINNRNLRTFTTSLQTTLTLKDAIPSDRLVITESGIHSPKNIQLMLDNEIYAFLVGESFMRAESPGQKMRQLFALPQ